MNKKLNFFSAIIFLSRYIKGYKKHFFIFYLGWVLDSALTVVMPILLGIMIDEFVYYQNLESFLEIAFLFLISILFSGVLYFFVYAQHGYLMNMFVFEIRKDIFIHLQRCNAQYFSNSSSGEIIAILQKYPEECMHFIIRNIIHFVNGIILTLLYIAYLIKTDWKIGTLAFVTGMLSVFINTVIKKRVRKLGDEERIAYEKNVNWIFEILTALRDLRLLGSQKRAATKFEKNQEELLDIERKKNVMSLMAEGINQFVNLIARLGIYSFAAYGAVRGYISVGILVIILSFYEKLVENISLICFRYLDSQNRLSYIQRIYDFFQIPTEKSGTTDLHIRNGEIFFENVSFSYDGSKKVLENFTLRIHTGERIAIVGKSGCGKSTLAYLLTGFYQPNNGEIFIDGQKCSECNIKSLRQDIGFVQQDILIFDGTIRENILMGNYMASEEEVLMACRYSGLEEYINSLEKGIDTVIGNEGVGLSGGQKQRIAIARIYLKNPSIIIFDEATSSLDSETENEIHRVWKEILKGKTAIVIAHRQSSVMLCDRVALIEEGRIVEMDETMRMIDRSERFKKLFAVKKEE